MINASDHRIPPIGPAPARHRRDHCLRGARGAQLAARGFSPRAVRQGRLLVCRVPQRERRPRRAGDTRRTRAAERERRHVAAWVGVGGAGQGPNGSDQWLQVGLAAFNGSGSRLYYEVTTGGAPPRYNEVVSEVPAGQKSRVAVLEMSKRPNWWRVWLNGKAVSRPIHLPGSSGRFRPIATAETWDGGVAVATASPTGSETSASPPVAAAAGRTSSARSASSTTAIA